MVFTDGSYHPGAMTSLPVLCLATLAGAGITGATIFFSAHVPPAPSRTAATPTTISSAAAAAWQAVRQPASPQMVQPEQASVASITPRPPSPSQTSASTLDRVSLTRELQRELKSRDCYHGEINGQWTPSTRQAMNTFTDRANAKLPVTEPDQVLLALIKGHAHYSCNETLREAVTAHPAPAKTPAAELGALLTPPMALAGPKTSDTDGKIAAPKTAAPRRVSESRQRSVERWSAELWRNSAN